MPEQTVLCDTTPLLYLHGIGCLDLLHRLYGEVVVPSAVNDELRAGALLGYGVPDVAAVSWVSVKAVTERHPVLSIPDLGKGETHTISLALALPGSLVIMDDALGRTVARLNSVKVTGTAGVLLRAKQRGYIRSVCEKLDALSGCGFWLDDHTRRRVLRLAGE